MAIYEIPLGDSLAPGIELDIIEAELGDIDAALASAESADVPTSALYGDALDFTDRAGHRIAAGDKVDLGGDAYYNHGNGARHSSIARGAWAVSSQYAE